MRKELNIKEELKDLASIEKGYRRKPQDIRVKAIRLKKQDPELSTTQIGEILGISVRTIQHWFSLYRGGGIQQLLSMGQRGKRRGYTKLTERQKEILVERLKTKGFKNLKEIRDLIRDEFGVDYGISGVWALVRLRLRAKLKTGRPRNKNQSVEEVEGFKKTLGKRLITGLRGKKFGVRMRQERG